MAPENEFDCSADWSLYDVRTESGLALIVERNWAGGRALDPPRPRRRIVFENPASWAFADLSLMNEYFPRDDCPPVLIELERMGSKTFFSDLTISTEAHGDQWRHFRVTTWSEIVDVIERSQPLITEVVG